MKVVTDQGTAVFGAGAQQAPDWIPNYPGGRTEGLANIEAKGEKSGTFTLRTADTPDTVTAFYESKLKEAGFEVQKASLSFNGAPSGTLNATAEQAPALDHRRGPGRRNPGSRGVQREALSREP